MKHKTIGVTLMALAMMASGWFVYWKLHFGPTAFDAAIWRGGEDPKFHEDAPRLRMADGLVHSGKFSKMRRAEVESMLGPPTETKKFGGYDLIYWLGPERSFFSIDSEWLVIRLAKDDTVELAEIIRD